MCNKIWCQTSCNVAKVVFFFMFMVMVLIEPLRVTADITQSGTANNVIIPTTLKVVFVQFNDVKWDKYWDGSAWQPYNNTQTMADYQDLLTSLGTYYNNRSDGDAVFGGFRDYFWENSRHNYSGPTVQILSDTDANGYPVCLELAGNKSSYNSFSFMSAANAAATAAGFDVSTNTYVKRMYIYAGNWVNYIGVFANGLHGSTIVTPDRYNRVHPTYDEDVTDGMMHMGFYAHELGHIMGNHHTRTSNHWSLMHRGHKAGTVTANRPASMNPWFLFKSDWANLNYINSDATNVSLSYNTSPTTKSTYYIRQVPGTGEKFLVENRQYNNTYDQSIPGAVVGLSGGILIWNILNEGLNEYATNLIEADNDDNQEMVNMAHDVFRPTVYTAGLISDRSTPANLNLRDGSFSKFAIDNYVSTGNPLSVDFLINYIETTVETPPPAPQNLVITNAGAVGQSPNLTWSASSGATSYNIYRRVSFLQEWLQFGSTPSTSFTDYTFEILDPSDPAADEFFYHVKAANSGGESGPSNSVSVWGLGVFKPLGEKPITQQPQYFELQQNFPNPFNPATELSYSLPKSGNVELVIVNLLGQPIRTLVTNSQPAGRHRITWDGRNNFGNQVGSGIYFYRIDVKPVDGSEPFTQIRKMSLLR